jgi:signal transduction histidine kinase
MGVQGDLFPRKLSIVAAALSCVWIAGVALLIERMHGGFSEVHRRHIPVLEMASINVRLAHAINVKSAFAIARPDVKILSELKEDLDSLEYNLKAFRESLDFNPGLKPLLAKLSSERFLESNEKLLALLKNGRVAEARELQRSPEYQRGGEAYAAAIGDLTEALSQSRDESLARQLHLMRAVAACFALLALVIGLLLARVYRGYRSNLTKRIEAEREVLLLSQQRKQLIHVLCHDLGNPVASISGLIGYVEKLEGAPRAKAIEMIKTSAAGAQSIIDLIRKLQALESGKLQLEMGDYSLAELVSESLAILRSRAEGKNLVLRVAIDAALIVRVERASFVNSVVSNVLTNAIKFSKPGSAIEITARASAGGEVLLAIRDHGVGMPRSLAASVFDELKSTSRAGTGGEEGTGFGMPLAKKFVIAYGGAIELSSSEAESDHGTEVRVTLKAA